MFGWRKKRDGFEWHEYVRTTILVRRAKRLQKVGDARQAAVDGLKGAGAAAVHGMHDAREAAAERLRQAGEAGRNMGASGVAGAASAARGTGSVLAHAFYAAITFSKTSMRVVAAGAVRFSEVAVTATARAAAPLLAWLSIGNRRLTLGAAAILTLMGAAYRFWQFGFDWRAGLIATFGLAALALYLAGEADVVTNAVRRDRKSRASKVDDRRTSPALTMERLAPIAGWGAFAAVMVFGVGRLLGPAGAPVGAAGSASPPVTTSSIALPKRSPLADALTGRAEAISGDTLRIGHRVVRLGHIEAPERGQSCTTSKGKHWRCGEAAREQLARLVRGRTIVCEATRDDGESATIADCRAGTADLAAALVENGFAFAETGFFAQHSGLESAARERRIGLWQGEAQRPAEYRATVWELAKKSAPEGCPIKGQVSSRGKRYVMPWMDGYDRIRIRTSRGGRWFCSEDEAIAAGWRPSAQS